MLRSCYLPWYYQTQKLDMTARDVVGMLLVIAGSALGLVAWSVPGPSWIPGAAILMMIGVLLMWRPERDRRILDTIGDAPDGGRPWRPWRRDRDRDVEGGGRSRWRLGDSAGLCRSYHDKKKAAEAAFFHWGSRCYPRFSN